MRAIEGAAAPREGLAGPDLERIVPPPSPPFSRQGLGAHQEQP